VLQTRYTAFYFRLVDHIIKTTHPNCRDFQEDKINWAKDLNKNGMFDSFDFVDLKILPVHEKEKEEIVEFVNDDEAYIEFEVTLRAREGATNDKAVAGEETVVKERSQFLRDPDSGIWTYSGGDVRSRVSGLEDTTLNV
jgi:SEC-C motif-containing protein